MHRWIRWHLGGACRGAGGAIFRLGNTEYRGKDEMQIFSGNVSMIIMMNFKAL